MDNVTALIVAAGKGTRCGGDLPKQFQTLNDRWVLDYSVETFAALMPLVIVTSGQWQSVVAEKYPEHTVVVGGDSRQESVLKGLEAVQTERVLVHDAARPFVKLEVIERLLAVDKAAVVPVLLVVDTVKVVADSAVQQTLDRDQLRIVQTPQLFNTKALYTLHRHPERSEGSLPATDDQAERKILHYVQDDGVTDDAALFERAGKAVQTVPGHPDTFKITTAADMQRARQMLSKPSYRVGSGFDVHAFTEGDHVMLGGVKIPHDKGLAAHSDGDVLLHALTDAILGAIGKGDIGLHFPPSDPQWQGATSDQFVEYAIGLMSKKGFWFSNIDITVIGERPKLTPHRKIILRNLEELTGTKNINLKATTTEKLGFTGREEGIAVQATVLIQQ